MATPPGAGDQPGLVWLTRADAESLATSSAPLTYTLDVKLANPSAMSSFVDPGTGFSGDWTSWQAIAAQDAKEITNEQLVLNVGSWLLGLLAVAGVAVLVSGRLAEQTRRVGLLKAVGGSPGFVTLVLLAEYLMLASAATAAGLAAGRLAAPMLTSFSFFAGLQVVPAEPPVTVTTAAVVLAAALAVAVLATVCASLHRRDSARRNSLNPRIPEPGYALIPSSPGTHALSCLGGC